MKHALIVLAVLAGVAWIFRKPLQELYEQRVSGLEAAADSATLQTYTTYNTQLYTPSLWTPVLKFFKANAYAPSGNQSGAAEQVNYSVQG